MKLLLLADINSAHTIKWASALASRGHEVGIFSCSLPGYPWYRKVKGVQAFLEAEGAKPVDVVQTFRPDILHAHYATRYGWIGRRTGFHPFVISAWGSDILEFPRKSVLHRFLLRYILGSADQLLATSHLLADAMKAYTTKVTEVLPFGIDTAFFTPVEHSRKRVVIGTIKSLEEIYGIDTLLKAYALLRQSHPDLDLSLRITGKGSLEAVYKQLSRDLGIEQEVVFTGWVNYEDIVTAYGELDIFVNVSRKESFGVSVLEAQACQIPVITSSIAGLREVSRPGISGLEVSPDHPPELAKALEILVTDAALRKKMGEAGRAFVAATYNWDDNVRRMEQIYESLSA